MLREKQAKEDEDVEKKEKEEAERRRKEDELVEQMRREEEERKQKEFDKWKVRVGEGRECSRWRRRARKS